MLLVLFILLFAGPVIVARFISLKSFGTLPLELLQPTGQNNNDTYSSVTGSALGNFGQDAAATGDSGTATGSDDTATASASSSGALFTFGGSARMAVRWATIA